MEQVCTSFEVIVTRQSRIALSEYCGCDRKSLPGGGRHRQNDLDTTIANCGTSRRSCAIKGNLARLRRSYKRWTDENFLDELIRMGASLLSADARTAGFSIRYYSVGMLVCEKNHGHYPYPSRMFASASLSARSIP